MNVFFVSLGCDKNLVDSEVMLGLFKEAGYPIIDEEKDAEIIVVNTCCFINDAKEESIQTILEMAENKIQGKCKLLITAGCMAERYKEEILREIPEVDALLGTASYQDIIKVIEGLIADNQSLQGEENRVSFQDIDGPVSRTKNRMLTTGGHYSYLKIAEGCDKHCTYCIIPTVRGKYRSVPMDDILEEARELSQKGVRELILVAQETTLYGVDLYGKKQLATLLRRLAQIEEIYWIRLLYCYPEEIDDELIQVIKEEEKVCKYLDVPIQHGVDNILKKMGRRTNQAEIKAIINKLRSEVKDIAIRTTLITGFPGETKEDHEALMEFVDEMEFDRLGVFTYSCEEDTPAAKMQDQVDEETKELRRNEIMALQQEVSLDKNQALIGQNIAVFIEGKITEENVYIGRTYRDAPNVDGFIYVNSPEDIISGEIIQARITHAKEYDLIGERVYEDELTQ